MNTIVQINRPMKSVVSNVISAVTRIHCLHTVCFTLFVVLFTLNASAQTLQEYDTMIASMKASPDATIRAAATHLNSLVYEVHPKIYLKNLVQTVTGQTDPVCLQTDDESLGLLVQPQSLYSKVELITVKINGPGDLSFVLNLANLRGFEHLKYVQFLCSYPIDPEVLNAVFTRNAPGVTVCYSVSIPN